MAASSTQAASLGPQATLELEVVLVRSHASEPWGLQLEYQLFRSTTSKDPNEQAWGCFAVVDTRPDSPAARDPALRVGDTIVGVDGKRVPAAQRDDFAELLSILHSKGRAVRLTLARHLAKRPRRTVHFDGEDEEVRLTVTTFEAHETVVEYGGPCDDDGDDEQGDAPEERVEEPPKPREDVESWAAYRLKFVPLDDESCCGARFDDVIHRPDGSARRGYEPIAAGDVLITIDGEHVVDLDYATILARLRRPPPLALRFAHAAQPRPFDDTRNDAVPSAHDHDDARMPSAIKQFFTRLLAPAPADPAAPAPAGPADPVAPPPAAPSS